MVPRVYAECKRNAKKRLTALFSSGIIRVSQVFSFGDVEMDEVYDVLPQVDKAVEVLDQLLKEISDFEIREILEEAANSIYRIGFDNAEE